MLTVRRIEKGESRLYKKLRLKSLENSPGAFGSTYSSALKRSPESWVEQADGGSHGHDRAIFFAFINDHAVGLAAIYRLETPVDVGELMQVWITPVVRRQGIAKTLLDTVLQWASENGYRAVTAGIMAGNEGAMTFYQNYGFIPEPGIELNCPGDAAVLIRDLK